MSAYDWNTNKLQSIVRWYGMVNLDPSAPAREEVVRKIDPGSAHGQLLVLLQDLFDLELEPKNVAERLANLVLGQGKHEPETTMDIWQFMIGAIIRASHHFEHDTLARLADTMVELSKLPHALPYHPIFGQHAANIKPGDLEFSQLPGLGLPLFENIQGPRQYFNYMGDVTFQARLAAQRQFRNINTFAAMLTRVYLSGLPCAGMKFTNRPLPVLSHALENEIPEGQQLDQSTVNYFRMGDPAVLALPAAIQWINVAGRELFEFASHQHAVIKNRAMTGSLLKATEGDRVWGTYRWEFWRQRLLYLAGREDLGPEISSAASKAADTLAAILK